MKNPMIENNINAELFEAIDENAINGGFSITSTLNTFNRPTHFGRQCGITILTGTTLPVVTIGVSVVCTYKTK